LHCCWAHFRCCLVFMFYNLRVFARSLPSTEWSTVAGRGCSHIHFSSQSTQSHLLYLCRPLFFVRWNWDCENSTRLVFLCRNIHQKITRKDWASTQRSKIWDFWYQMRRDDYHGIQDCCGWMGNKEMEKIWYLVECDCYEILITLRLRDVCLFLKAPGEHGKGERGEAKWRERNVHVVVLC